MILAYFLLASRLSSSDLAPVTTILPEAKISAVVLGSRIRMMTAAKRYEQGRDETVSTETALEIGMPQPPQLFTFGLYSALRACKAIVFRSNLTSKLTVATMFCKTGNGNPC